MSHRPAHPIQLGLRQNVAQFTLLVAVNALVGGMLGQERTVLPLLASDVFGLAGYTAALTYILAFGVAKAATNYFAGTLSDRFGRKPVLVAGWLVALPVPLLLIWAPSWAWVVAANVLLGVSQGLTWSTTVVMKIDLVGPARRGLAMGFNEAAGYGAVAADRAGHRLPGRRATACAPRRSSSGSRFAALGLGPVDAVRARDPRATPGSRPRPTSPAPTAATTTWRRPDQRPGLRARPASREPALSSASQAGLVNNLNDGLAWGLFPVLFAPPACPWTASACSPRSTPPCGASGQLVTGGLSDRWGRKWLIAAGMWLQAVGPGVIAAAAGSFGCWAVAAVLLGAGTAMVYPTLLAVDRRRRPPGVAGPRGRHLPALARRRLRRRRAARRHPRRRLRHPRRDLGRRRPHRRLRRGRRGPHVRDPTRSTAGADRRNRRSPMSRRCPPTGLGLLPDHLHHNGVGPGCALVSVTVKVNVSEMEVVPLGTVGAVNVVFTVAGVFRVTVGVGVCAHR